MILQMTFVEYLFIALALAFLAAALGVVLSVWVLAPLRGDRIATLEAANAVSERFRAVQSSDETDLGLWFIFDSERERHDQYAHGSESYPMVTVEGEARTTEARDYAMELVALLNAAPPDHRQ
jgi:branched-subunit amino acid ABC-type transport system permease component